MNVWLVSGRAPMIEGMSTRWFPDVWVDPDDDPREGVPSLGDTRSTADRGQVSLREVLVHMIEEYARHNGHADLLRERIDGRTGQ
jgi:hypothetical protein